MINYLIWCFWSFYHFLHSNVPANKCHKQKWCMLLFTSIKLVVSVLVCAHVITCIKWRILMTTSILSWIKFYKISIKIWIFFRLLPFSALLPMTHQGGNQTSKVSCYRKLLMLHIYNMGQKLDKTKTMDTLHNKSCTCCWG